VTARLDISRSPYVVGAGLGLVNALAFATAGRGLGITSAFENVAALTERRLAPDAVNINAYLQKREEPPRIDWETFLVAGVLAGSFLAASAAAEPATPEIPARWQRRFGPSRGKRYAAAFAGGAAMMFGARMAKGCTSGHGLTGTTQLAVSSLVFTPLMFATGMLVTRLLYGKEER
jgi:uncharacterized membrane protein YedE/YeeE